MGKAICMKFLFRPIDIASLAFFRFVFGILAFADVTGTLTYKHWYKNYLDPEAFHFKYYGFEWVAVFGDPWMTLYLLSMMVASLCIAVGYRYRLAIIYLTLSFSYYFFMEKAFYLNHGYFFCLLAFLMIFMPAHRNFSFDIFRKPQIYLERIPYWPVFLLKFMMGVVYFFGGIAKINPDWVRAQPLKIWLKAKSNHPLIGGLLEYDFTAYFMSYGGLLLDLFVVFFLLSKRTRKWAFFAVLFFHITNVLVFEIGIFPWLSISLTALYFAPEFPRHIFNWLQARAPRLRLSTLAKRWAARLDEKGIVPNGQSLHYRPAQQRRISWAIGIWCCLHLLIPLRHHYFPGRVAWTEEGHRYSWRMMLRSKRGYGYFMVKDGISGKEEKVSPGKYLNSKQGYKVYTHPDMILQFAHYLRDKFEAEGMEQVEVYAHIKCRLNDGKNQKYIDETVDLAKEEWTFLTPSEWVLPLLPENAPQ